MTAYRVGWHVNGSGGHRGALGEYIAQLAAGGHRPVVNAVDDAGLAVEIANAGGIAVYRKDQWSAAPDYNVTAQEAARVRWDGIKALIPPEIKAVKDKVIIEVTNEPDRARADWLGRFMKRISELGNADGYAIGGPSWAAGNPEISDWETQGMLDYLHYVGTHADMNAICLHEYSLDSADITTGTPWLVGRYQFMFDVCEAHDLLKPPVIITELGWSYRTLPGSGVMQQIDWAAQLYEHIPVCWWTLGSGTQWGDLPQKLSAYVDDVTQWVLDNSEPEPDEPPDDDGLWYKSISVLAPQDYTLEQMLELRRRNYEQRRTITQSHDEALQLRKLGQPGSYTIVYDIGRWPAEIRAALTAGGHELESLEPLAQLNLSMPLTGTFVISSRFNAPRDYDNDGQLDERHEGIDFAPRTSGALCIAPAPGIVEHVGFSPNGYGHYVRIRHQFGALVAKTWLAHMKATPEVTVGQTVAAGQRLGLVGSSGNSSGDHVHLTLEVPGHGLSGYVVNDVVNPEPFIDLSIIAAPDPPPTGIDLIPYMRGDGRLYEVQHSSGASERFQSQTGTDNVFYQTKNNGWEEFFYDANFIWRGLDSTPGPAPSYAERPGADRFYVQREPGFEHARWCKRHMTVGETFTGPGHTVSFFYKSDCVPSAANSGGATNRVTLTGRHANRVWNGITVNDVISLSNGTETWFFARGWGMVAWESPWGVSAISEVHAPGERPPNQREVIGCL